ncbi:hypothetical protein P9112_008389 [Eukaryota sp. TZLM1-RC]
MTSFCCTYAQFNTCPEIEKTCHLAHSEFELHSSLDANSTIDETFVQLFIFCKHLLRLAARRSWNDELEFASISDVQLELKQQLSTFFEITQVRDFCFILQKEGVLRNVSTLTISASSLVEFMCNNMEHSGSFQTTLPILSADLPGATLLDFEKVVELFPLQDSFTPFVPNFSTCIHINIQLHTSMLNVPTLPSTKLPVYLCFRNAITDKLIGLYPIPRPTKQWRAFSSFLLCSNNIFQPGDVISIEALSSELFSLSGLVGNVTLTNYSASRVATVCNVISSPLPCGFASSLSFKRPVIQQSGQGTITVEVLGINLSSVWIVLKSPSSEYPSLAAPLKPNGYPSPTAAMSWTLRLLLGSLYQNGQILWRHCSSQKPNLVSCPTFTSSFSCTKPQTIPQDAVFTPYIVGLIHSDIVILNPVSQEPVAFPSLSSVGFQSFSVLPLISSPSPLIGLNTPPAGLFYGPTAFNSPLPLIPPPPIFKRRPLFPPKRPKIISTCESDQEFDDIISYASTRFLKSPSTSVSPLCQAAQVSTTVHVGPSKYSLIGVDSDSESEEEECEGRCRTDSAGSFGSFGIGTQVEHVLSMFRSL